MIGAVGVVPTTGSQLLRLCAQHPTSLPPTNAYSLPRGTKTTHVAQTLQVTGQTLSQLPTVHHCWVYVSQPVLALACAPTPPLAHL